MFFMYDIMYKHIVTISLLFLCWREFFYYKNCQTSIRLIVDINFSIIMSFIFGLEVTVIGARLKIFGDTNIFVIAKIIF